MTVADLKRVASERGGRISVTSASRLADLQREIDEFKKRGDLNGFQRWIVNDLYDFSIPETGFTVRSIIVHAIKRPIWTNVEFDYKGRRIKARAFPSIDIQAEVDALRSVLEKSGFHMREAGNIPLKRFAVQSGLAEYGRNNITYINGLGSAFAYNAYFSDIPADGDCWREMCVSNVCEGCLDCVKRCPTGAILADRFLIDNTRCLSFLNEGEGELPAWLDKNVHHTIYDCLRCQESCPLNYGQQPASETVYFTESEISALIDGTDPEALGDDFMRRANSIDMFRWTKKIGRNIKALTEAANA